MNALEQLSAPVSVILVEDDQYLRASLVEYLELKGLRVCAVGTAAAFYQQLERHTFQVAVIDIGLPDASGETLVDFCRKNSEMSLVVITANDGLNSRVSCYRSGADLFMAKPIEGQELAAAIISLAERCYSRNAPEPRHVEQTLSWVLDYKSWTLTTPDQQEIDCTVKEFRLLSLLAENLTEPTQRRDLLKTLYGRDDDSAQRALDTLVRRLRKKIQQFWNSENSPIRTVYSVGYLFTDQIEKRKD